MTASINPNDPKSKFALLRSAAKFVLPGTARQLIHSTHRAVIFHRAMNKFLLNIEHGLPFDRRILLDLIYGWGNEAWSADTEYLLGCLHHAQGCQGPVLECGSGLSTLLVGAVLQKSGGVLYSLEHQKNWGDRVSSFLKRYGIDSVLMHVHPLKEYADFTWYEIPAERLFDKYPLVVCDGPPSATRGGRYGLIPLMKSQLAPGCVILLDDADRTHEQVIANRWAQELDTPYETLGSTQPYIRFELNKNTNNQPDSILPESIAHGAR